MCCVTVRNTVWSVRGLSVAFCVVFVEEALHAHLARHHGTGVVLYALDVVDGVHRWKTAARILEMVKVVHTSTHWFDDG